MDRSSLDALVEQVRREHSSLSITPRDLFGAFGLYRRTSGNCWIVDKYLEEHEVFVSPHYNDVWIDTPIELKEKTRATRKIAKDPIQRIKIIPAANNNPVCVQNDSSLTLAITLMQSNNFSQLPVTDGNKRNLSGYISWDSISNAIFRGVHSEMVKDYKVSDCVVMTPNDSLIDAMTKVHKHDFVIIVENNQVKGIITQQDLSRQFLNWTKPFILLEEIENHIRQLIDGKFQLEELRGACQGEADDINCVDDMSFGDYIALIGNEDRWNKLNLKYVDRGLVVAKLEEVRKIRNDVMHFDPEGLTRDQCITLEATAQYLRILSSKID